MRVTSKGVTGSSPQMRGALDLLVDLGARAGIIPADAGSTAASTSWTAWTRDHPRRCGEHEPSHDGLALGDGSSPQMRGARGDERRTGVGCGIIPADAGSTCPTRTRPHRPGGSSPQMRGARRHHPPQPAPHRIIPADAGSTTAWPTGCRPGDGSSPQMRGALTYMVLARSTVGIIPADAGSTLAPVFGWVHRKDHPRRCGEHQIIK